MKISSDLLIQRLLHGNSTCNSQNFNESDSRNSRYEVLSFRNAIGSDQNFIWCQNCDFGQLHESGLEHPIIRCLKCSFRSCFRHKGPWHERMTCEEYDEMLKDPEGFKSAVDRGDEEAIEALRKQQEADELMARELEAQDRQAEEDRQRAKHEEALRKARAAQEAEAARKRKEIEDKERAKRAAEIRQRQQQEAAALQLINSTTKRCPGCQWPIEKNQGCSHMTCKSLKTFLQSHQARKRIMQWAIGRSYRVTDRYRHSMQT